jgi:hypothetical protein
MNRKTLTGIIIAAVAAFLIAYFASPLLAVNALTKAAKTGDEAELTRLVDFPALRASAKEELRARMIAEMRVDGAMADAALSGLGMVLAPALASGLIDVLVTPEAVGSMVRNAKTPNPADRVRETEETTPEVKAAAQDDIRQSFAYRDLNTFALTLTDPERPDQPLVLILDRRGLFDWKLSGIDLTPDN